VSEGGNVMRNVLYWTSTLLVSVASVFAAISYLMAAPQTVAAFTHVGYPQQLRVMLGIAKPLGAAVLLIPGFPKIKEWAYAGFGFAWTAAFVAHYLAGDGPIAFAPLVLLVVLGISYRTRPANRQMLLKMASTL
jgi:DoxX-like family